MFTQYATSCGLDVDGKDYWNCGGVNPLFPQKTIYDAMVEHNRTVGIYTHWHPDEPGGSVGLPDAYVSQTFVCLLLRSAAHAAQCSAAHPPHPSLRAAWARALHRTASRNRSVVCGDVVLRCHADGRRAATCRQSLQLRQVS
jgi:hypothetical protein